MIVLNEGLMWCREVATISTDSHTKREEKGYDHEKEGMREKKEEGREMMCTHLRVKLDHRSARARIIKYIEIKYEV